MFGWQGLLYAGVLFIFARCNRCVSGVGGCAGNISVAEYDAIQDMYNSLAGWSWRWDSDEPASTIWEFPCSLSAPCSQKWQGLECSDSIDATTSACVIKSLVLVGRNLSGAMSSSISALSSLEILSLGVNNITGSIVTTLGRLSALQLLDFYGNQLTGSLPSELAGLVNIKSLGFAVNLLSGEIPSEMASLQELDGLYVYDNRLVGSIPSEIFSLPLKSLELGTNLLSGTLSSSIGNLRSHVLELELYENLLHGNLPTEIGLLTNLQALQLYSNCLTGTLPTELGKLNSLQDLELDNNVLSSTIISEIGQLTSLAALKLSSNFLSGSLPTYVGLLVSLVDLDVSANYLQSSLPSQLQSFTRLKALSANSNLLSGTIGASLPHHHVQDIDLGQNLLSGMVSSNILNASDLQLLVLNGNELSGSVPLMPAGIQNLNLANNRLTGDLHFLSILRVCLNLDISANKFGGLVPTYISDWKFLQALNFSTNQLSGPITFLVPTSNRSLTILQSVDISSNYFSGSILADLFSELPKLQTVILSQNCFGSTIPSTLCDSNKLENILIDVLTGNCGNAVEWLPFRGVVAKKFMLGSIPECVWNSSTIKIFHMVGNGIRGTLPELSPSSQLEILSLGSNQLFGTIPVSFLRHSFSQFDLSINMFSGTLKSDLNLYPHNTSAYNLNVNRLSGPIPTALYQQFNSSVLNILDGNLFGCNKDGLPPSDVGRQSYTCGSTDFENTLLTWLVGIALGCVSATAVLGGCSSAVKPIVSCKELSQNQLLTRIIFGPLCLVAMCVFALFGYLIFKQPAQWHEYFITHTYQYWWISSIVFLRGIGPVIFLLTIVTASSLCVSVGLLLFANWHYDVASENDVAKLQVRLMSLAHRIAIHAVNIVVVTVANAIYIVRATNSLTGSSLLLVQGTLGLFKLFWSAKAIPKLVSHATDENKFADWVFMVLFNFIGAPYTSAFCESSYCFLYVLTAPRAVKFSFFVPALTCSTECRSTCHGTSCGTGCAPICDFRAQVPVYGDLPPPWIYSYQCSSAVLTNYVPVLLLSNLALGVAEPIRIYFSYISRKDLSVVSNFLGLLLMDPNGSRDEKAVKVVCTGRIGKRLLVKFILDIELLMTFGVACPLLGVAVFVQSVMYFGVNILLMENFISRCDEIGLNKEEVRTMLMGSLELGYRHCFSCGSLMMGFVGLFWSLFVFDMIGDDYGPFPAGLTSLFVLVSPLVICLVILRQFLIPDNKMRARYPSCTEGVELAEIGNPVMRPQSLRDKFSTWGTEI
jgi:Leucine-rich repeat (LRR) protein